MPRSQDARVKQKRNRDRKRYLEQMQNVSEFQCTAPKQRKYTAQGSLDDYIHGLKTFPPVHDLGPMNNMCRHCDALMWKNELHTGTLKLNATFSTCCMQGKVKLPSVSDPPDILMHLLTDESSEARHFRQNIRAFNSSLAFASLGVKEDILPSKGPYTFRINGTVYHRIGHLFPEEGEQPKFSQIYIHDTQNELSHRTSWNSELNKKILLDLQNMLHEHNPFAKCFKHAADIVNNDTTGNEDMKLVLKADTNKDLRRFNLPTASELAVIIPGSSTSVPTKRDIVLYKHFSNHPDRHKVVRINETHPHYDPLHYVLLFPNGEMGWTIGIAQTENRTAKISAMQFYSYRLMQRQNFNIILRSGRLLHQYIVDQYAKIEQERLNYCLYHQSELRAELYQGLSDSVEAGDTDGTTVGRKIVLPSSFIGGPRNMHQLYQDAMAIVRRYGKPDLFITFTCNPKWPGIVNSLLNGQTPADRPDLVSRVFHQKVRELIKDITHNNIFGKTLAHVYTIEFQKRGLPHAHLLIILESRCKPNSADEYDVFVSAEIPDLSLVPQLYDVVTQHMIHGPCGEANRNSPCMENGKCMKQYPKQFSENTIRTSDGYPKYKRRDNGVTFEKHGVILDNRWVVPYNPYLCAKYSAHINVEICSSITAVKYLYKYVYKGHDRIMASIQQEPVNEIKRYIDARYVSASEASWRIFHYELHNRSPAIQRLAVHLPGQQSVIYREGHAEEDLQHVKDTTLTAWFKINKELPDARHIPYHMFPERFTWNHSVNKWKARTSKNVIGRLYQASPAEGERFYLRLLLHHTPGCTSFEHIRTLPDGSVCKTFKDAALKLGFLHDDDEWVDCLKEAVITASPSHLRLLFVTILLFCEPSNPVQLWDSFKQNMSEDISHTWTLRNVTVSDEHVKGEALKLINQLLKLHGKSLKDYPGMPVPTETMNQSENMSTVMMEELNYSKEIQSETAVENETKMNMDQCYVYNLVIQAVLSNDCDQSLFFVDGPGGTGKTFLYNTILANIRSKGKIALAVASSGIAAELLEGGRTAHSRFKIPIPILATSTCNISRQSALAELIRRTSVIIWDEAPMVHKFVFECVHRTLCDIMGNDKPFGGIVVLLGGDFRQVLPVVRHGSQADIIESNLQRSFLWNSIQLFHLTTNMRIRSSQNFSGDAAFENLLLSIGNGNEEVFTNIGPAKIKLPQNLCINPDDRGMHTLISNVYPDLNSDSFKRKMYARAILSSKNDSVDHINKQVMELFSSEDSKIYLSADTVADPSQTNVYPTEFLNSLNLSGLPPHSLHLKKYAPVILLRNLNPREGLLNGTRLSIVNLGGRVIEAKIMTGRHVGNTVFLPRVSLTPSDSGLPFQLKRRQFPVRPAFAMTINKSQGQTLDYIGLDLSEPVFTHGQLYVALSRVRSFDSISILPDRMTCFNGNCFTDNIVYKEVLQ